MKLHKVVFQSERLLTYTGEIIGKDERFLHLRTRIDGNIQLAWDRVVSITEIDGEF
jgi:hypothetical protein